MHGGLDLAWNRRARRGSKRHTGGQHDGVTIKTSSGAARYRLRGSGCRRQHRLGSGHLSGSSFMTAGAPGRSSTVQTKRMLLGCICCCWHSFFIVNSHATFKFVFFGVRGSTRETCSRVENMSPKVPWRGSAGEKMFRYL